MTLKCELEQQLKEATALLERCPMPDPDLPTSEHTQQHYDGWRAFAEGMADLLYGASSRTPARPAAPTHEAVASSIASAAHLRAYGTDLGPWIDSVESRLQPAAPEPSGHTYCQRCQAMAGAMCGICRSFRVTAAESRAESAEAQLAAVRKLLAWAALAMGAPWNVPRAAGLAIQREIRGITLTAEDALLTDPSPGAGEETL